MSTNNQTIEQLANQEYKYGFVSDIDAESVPKGLSEETIRLISAKKNEPEFMLEWRLQAYRHWLKMKEPRWANIRYSEIDYQNIIYYSAPTSRSKSKSIEDVDPEILKLYTKLGIPLAEQELMAGVAVDAVLDSVSVATTFKGKLSELGIVFCSFSEAVQKYPDLIKKYLGSVVPTGIIFLQPLIQRCSRTALLSMCLKGYTVPWSSRPILESTPPTPVSLSARSLWRRKAAM